MKVQFKKLHENAKVPVRGSQLAGGWDVTCTRIEEKDDTVICYLGFAVAIPEGYKLTIVPRSNLTKHKWILNNSPVLVDSDYRGEIQLRFKPIPTGFEFLHLAEENCFEPFYKSHLTINHLESSVCFDNDPFPYEVGDRIAQCYLEEVIPIEFEEVNELDETLRGEGGFGSTGMK